MDHTNYYAILGVDRSSSPQEIARAFRRLARKHHPDVNPHDADAERRFKAINEAYLVLSDPAQRAQYDQQLTGVHPSWPPASSPAGTAPDEQSMADQQAEAQWDAEGLGAVLQQAANDFAADMQEALRDFGEELDALARSYRGGAANPPGGQGFPPPPPPGRPPFEGRPPNKGRPPFDGKAPRP
jgi:curved DNA-binding protein CbpA